jgi:hypothetical protein
VIQTTLGHSAASEELTFFFPESRSLKNDISAPLTVVLFYYTQFGPSEVKKSLSFSQYSVKEQAL